jgi:hypothetical protein
MRDARGRKFDLVIVARFDRFARSVSHLLRALEEFNHLGVDFVSLSESVDTSTPLGKMIFTVLGAVAELERNLIKERIHMGLGRARKQGKQLGRPKRLFDREKAWTMLQNMSAREVARQLGVSPDISYALKMSDFQPQSRLTKAVTPNLEEISRKSASLRWISRHFRQAFVGEDGIAGFSGKRHRSESVEKSFLRLFASRSATERQSLKIANDRSECFSIWIAARQ